MPTSRKINAHFLGRIVIAENKNLAKELYDKSRFGELVDKKIQYSLVEALYLIEKMKLVIKEDKKSVKQDDFIKMAIKLEKDFWTKYIVFRDMRNRGYIVKTALKFGADFRVYDRGIKPGEDHAKWILFPVSESKGFTWHTFSAMNRVAHSTRKNLLVGIVDSESDVTYYQIQWTKP
jgi:tRNA-intron endonuclease